MPDKTRGAGGGNVGGARLGIGGIGACDGGRGTLLAPTEAVAELDAARPTAEDDAAPS